MNIRHWVLPLRLISIFLGGLSLLAASLWHTGDRVGLGFAVVHFLLLFGSNLGVTTILNKYTSPLHSPWENRFITTSILFLLFDSLTPWWAFIFLGASTRLLESFVRLPSGPVFNPAALGSLLLCTLGVFPTWWGTDFAPRFTLFQIDLSIAFLLTLFIAGFVAYRYRKTPLILAGFSVFALTSFFLTGENPLSLMLNGAFLFFFLVMAIEPKTSPNKIEDQLIYGSIIGASIPILLQIHFLEASLGALLLANVYSRGKEFWLYQGKRFFKSV